MKGDRWVCRCFGHKFRPRYHERWSGPEWLVELMKQANAEVKQTGEPKQDHTKSYLYDVCVRCGVRTEEG